MKRFLKDERADFEIDAIFGITFFMLAMIVILFMCLIIRVQSNIQYAIGQTAKEISGYYYLVDKLGLAAATTGSTAKTDVDTVIGNVVDFSGKLGDTKDSIDSIEIDGATLDDIMAQAKDVEGNVKASYDSFLEIEKSVKGLNADSVTQIISLFAKTAANRAVSYFIAPIVCEKLMPKYLMANPKGSSIQDYYDAVGIKNVSFTGSQLLTDKRSIKVQISYELDVENYTLGLVKTSMKFRQVASTAAWVKPDGTNLYNLEELGY